MGDLQCQTIPGFGYERTCVTIGRDGGSYEKAHLIGCLWLQKGMLSSDEKTCRYLVIMACLKASNGPRLPYPALPFLVFLRGKQGSGPDRGQNPFVRPSVRLSVHPPSGPTSQAWGPASYAWAFKAGWLRWASGLAGKASSLAGRASGLAGWPWEGNNRWTDGRMDINHLILQGSKSHTLPSYRMASKRPLMLPNGFGLNLFYCPCNGNSDQKLRRFLLAFYFYLVYDVLPGSGPLVSISMGESHWPLP